MIATQHSLRAERWYSGLRFFMRRQRSLLGVVLVLAAMPFIFRMDPLDFKIFTDLRIWRFLSQGVGIVVFVSIVSIVISLPLAIGFALGRLSNKAWVRWPSIVYVESIRSLPLLLVILYIFLKMPPQTPRLLDREVLAVIAALTIYTAAVNAELIRAGILSLERGQFEASRSLGMTYWQSMQYIVLPQTFQRVMAPLIAQFTTLLKDTSLGSIIGMVELLQRGKIIFQGYRNPMETLYVVAIIYFVLNYILEQVSLALQRSRQESN